MPKQYLSTTAVKTLLFRARDEGKSSRKLEIDQQLVEITVTSAADLIIMSAGPFANLPTEVFFLINHTDTILRKATDAIYTSTDTKGTFYNALWAHPTIIDNQELDKLAVLLYQDSHQVIALSENLRNYLIPKHPAEWPSNQSKLWQDIWRLRLEDPYNRQRISHLSHPKLYPYFSVLADNAAKRVEDPKLSSLHESLTSLYYQSCLTGHYLFWLTESTPANAYQLDFRIVSKHIAEQADWDSVPIELQAIINEINIADLRTSGKLFKSGVQAPANVLNAILAGANKCSAFGFISNQVMQNLLG